MSEKEKVEKDEKDEKDEKQIRAEMEKVHEKVREFLVQMDFKQISEDREGLSFELPLNVDFSSGETITLKNRVLVSQSWILCKCCVMFFSDIPPDQELFHSLLEEMLSANFVLAEVTFSLDEQKNIYLECDMPPTTTFTNFECEMNSIPFGVLHFFNEIVPKVSANIKKRDTFERSDHMYT